MSYTAEQLRAMGIPVPGEQQEEKPATPTGRRTYTGEELKALGIPLPSSSEPVEQEAEAPVVDPGSIHSRMWEGMTFKEADQKYRSLLEDENVEDPGWNPFGTAVYVDPESGERRYIPRPEMDTPGVGDLIGEAASVAFTDRTIGDALEDFRNPKAEVSNSQLAVMGAKESTGAIAEAAAAGVDWAAGTDLVDDVRSVFSNVDTSKSTVDSLVADGVPALALSLTGAGTAANLRTAFQSFPAFLKQAAKFWSAETAAAASVSTDEGTLFWGDVDVESPEAEDILQHRMRTLVEGVALGSAMAGLTWSTRQVWNFSAGGFIDAFRTASSKDALEKDVFYQLTEQLSGLGQDTPPEARQGAINRIAELVKDNKDVVVQRLSDIEETADLQLDTLTSIIRGIDPEDTQAIARIEGIGTGVGQKTGGEGFLAARQQPAMVLRRELDEKAAALGGNTVEEQTEAMLRSAEGLADTGRREIEGLTLSVEEAQKQYDQKAEELLSLAKNDPVLGKSLARLEEATGTDLTSPRKQSFEALRDGIRESYEKLKARKNELYSRIQGGSIDVDAIIDQFDVLATDEILASEKYLRNQSPIYDFLEAIKPRVADEVQETPEEVTERVAAWLENNGSDFGWFQRELRPELSALAERLYSNPATKNAGRITRDLIRFIDEDMVDYVAKTDPELAGAAKEAKRFYKEEFAELFGPNSGVGGDYARIYESTIGRTSAADLEEGAVEFGLRGYQEDTVNLLRPVLSGSNEDAVKNLAAALGSADRADSVADYMLMDVVESYGEAVRKDGLDNVDLTSFTERMQASSMALREVFPEKAQMVDQFLQRVQEGHAAKEGWAEEVDRLTKLAEQRRGQILSEELKPFFDSGTLNPTSNGFEAFQQLFKGKEAINRIADIRGRIADLPEANRAVIESGMQLAYTRMLRESLFGATKETGGVAPVLPRNILRANTEVSNLFRVGDAVFEDQPVIMDTLRALSSVAEQTAQSKNAKPNATWSPTAYANAMTESSNRMINIIIGPLNRTATQARTLVRTAAQKLRPEDAAAKVMDKILADPNYFLELHTRFQKDPMDPAVIEELLRYSTQTAVRTESAEEDGDSLLEQMESASSRVRQGMDAAEEWLR